MTGSGFMFNIDGGYLEGLCRGFKCGILKQSDYLNLVQCETLEGKWLPRRWRNISPEYSKFWSGILRGQNLKSYKGSHVTFVCVCAYRGLLFSVWVCVCAWIALQWNECKRDDDNQNKVIPTDVESKRGYSGVVDYRRNFTQNRVSCDCFHWISVYLLCYHSF